MKSKRLSLALAILGSFRSAFGFEFDREEHHSTRAWEKLNETPIVSARQFLDQCSNGNNVKYYYFKFEDGTLANGITDQDVAHFTVDGNEFKLDITCTDTFTGGYGTVEGPVKGLSPAVIMWEIVNCKSGEIYESCDHSHGSEMIVKMAMAHTISSKSLKGTNGRSLTKSAKKFNKDKKDSMNVSLESILESMSMTTKKQSKNKMTKRVKNESIYQTTAPSGNNNSKYKSMKKGKKESKNGMKKSKTSKNGNGAKSPKLPEEAFNMSYFVDSYGYAVNVNSESILESMSMTTMNQLKKKMTKKGEKKSKSKTATRAGNNNSKYKSTKKGKKESKNGMKKSKTSKNVNGSKSTKFPEEAFNMSYFVDSYGYAVNVNSESILESMSMTTKKQSKNKMTKKGGKKSKSETATRAGNNNSKYKSMKKSKKESTNGMEKSKTSKNGNGSKSPKFPEEAFNMSYFVDSDGYAVNVNSGSILESMSMTTNKQSKDKITKKGEKKSKSKTATPSGSNNSKYKSTKKGKKESKNGVKKSKTSKNGNGTKSPKFPEEAFNMSYFVDSFSYAVNFNSESILESMSMTTKKQSKNKITKKVQKESKYKTAPKGGKKSKNKMPKKIKKESKFDKTSKGKKATKTSKGQDASDISYFVKSYGYAVKVDLDNILMPMPAPHSKKSKKGKKATKKSKGQDASNMSYFVKSYGYAVKVDLDNILMSMPDPKSKKSKKGNKTTKPSFFEDPFDMSYLFNSYYYAENVNAQNILKSLPESSFLRQSNEGRLGSIPVLVSFEPVAQLEASHDSGNGNAAIIGGTVGFAAVASVVAILLKKKYFQSSNTAALDQLHEDSL